MSRAAALLIVLLCAGCDMVVVDCEVTVDSVYEEAGKHGASYWYTIVETSDGHRLQLTGKRGVPGDKFRLSTERRNCSDAPAVKP